MGLNAPNLCCRNLLTTAHTHTQKKRKIKEWGGPGFWPSVMSAASISQTYCTVGVVCVCMHMPSVYETVGFELQLHFVTDLSGVHSSFVGCGAVLTRRNVPWFRMNILPPSSDLTDYGRNMFPETVVPACVSTLRHNPEYHHRHIYRNENVKCDLKGDAVKGGRGRTA